MIIHLCLLDETVLRFIEREDSRNRVTPGEREYYLVTPHTIEEICTHWKLYGDRYYFDEFLASELRSFPSDVGHEEFTLTMDELNTLLESGKISNLSLPGVNKAEEAQKRVDAFWVEIAEKYQVELKTVRPSDKLELSKFRAKRK